MGLRPPKVMKTKVGRTPWSARVPLDPLFGRRRFSQQADEGVGCGPGGPPHEDVFKGACEYCGTRTVVVALPRGRGSVRRGDQPSD
jgi:hypothetical protein